LGKLEALSPTTPDRPRTLIGVVAWPLVWVQKSSDGEAVE